jgi:N-acetylmuramoyl-L-alanine amidase
MADYIIVRGDCLSSIAKRHGFASWRTIYDHPQNADFRRLRPDPNLIHPGDRVFIPEREPREESGATEERHTFRTRSERVKLMIRIQQEDGTAVAGADYRLFVRDTGEETSDVTDGEGIAEAPIGRDCERATVEVWPHGRANPERWEWEILIGELDPLECVSGQQGRLNNLGFDSGPVDGIKGPLTKAAIERFQDANGLAVDAIVGPNTRAAFREEHGI